MTNPIEADKANQAPRVLKHARVSNHIDSLALHGLPNILSGVVRATR